MKGLYKYFTVAICCLVISTSYGQQPPVNSLYMFDQLLINPAYAGAQVQLSATGVHRNQWVNLPGAPVTSSFTAQSTFAYNSIGVGVIFINDQIGVHRDNIFMMAYSYKIKLPDKSEISFGLQGGLQGLTSDWDELTRKQDDNTLTGFTKSLKFNVGTGMFYTNRDFYMGISVPYMLNSRDYESLGTLSESRRRRVYFLTAGNTFQPSPDLKWIPQAMIRMQEGAPFTFDINNHFVYKDAVGLGMTYRLTEGFVGMFELKLNENLHVGYAYDMTMSELQRYSNGTHEILVNYRYKIPALHKGLECPSYF